MTSTVQKFIRNYWYDNMISELQLVAVSLVYVVPTVNSST
jgi:hypothetical protein